MRSPEEINKIRELVDALCNKSNSFDRDLPRYIYHFSDIQNIVSILKSGYVASRNFAIENGLMKNENACLDVISKTTHDNKNLARFYFRPKTPTQYHNEGIKSKFREYENEAHIPVPVFLVFDAVGMFSKSQSMFVERNLVYSPPIKKHISELEKFDFDKIYHSSSLYGYSSYDKQEIIEKRHAEVLFKDFCSLDCLRSIVCRSLAEKDTLIHLLRLEGVDVSQYRIVTNGNELLYKKNRAFIEFVELESTYFKIDFKNFETLTDKDELKLMLRDLKTDHQVSLCFPANTLIRTQTWRLKESKASYELKIKLNDDLIYFGEFHSNSAVPF
ncbi:DarT ssDNA thymidine ADP-ribosyltransferase family protein [Lysinibacillus fusiformis]|uniref:DarT ssDNA thymidine ADP-ribosyltransferase family protein n=1 Tax=Lysinibacillus fusiformis TaxID=28031 RepID=UPI003AAE4F56